MKPWNALPVLLAALMPAAALAQGAPRLLRDVNPATVRGRSSAPTRFHPVPGGVVFIASDDLRGRELWFTDGAGATPLPEIAPGREHGVAGDVRTGRITRLGDTVLFVGAAGGGQFQQDEELWRTDGSAAGTWRVLDGVPGPEGSEPVGLVAIGGLAFFAARTRDTGLEPWRSDGSAAGTFPIADLEPGPLSSTPEVLAEAPGFRCVFRARTAATGGELFLADATSASLLVDIEPGTSSSNPDHLYFDGTRTWFSAATAGEGREPWVTDGTVVGTRRLVDLMPGPTSSNARWFATMGGITYFVAEGPGAFDGLYRSDGSTAGTWRVHAARVTSPPVTLQDALLVHGATTGPLDEAEPWSSDGTAAGTRPLRSHAPGSTGLRPVGMISAGDHVVFAGDDEGVTGQEPWRSDGTPAGTMLIADVQAGPRGGMTGATWRAMGLIWFSGCGAPSDCEPWATDGTAAGTRRIADLQPETTASAPVPLANVEGRLLFQAWTSAELNEPWISDGTDAGTMLLADLSPPTANDGAEALGLFAGDAIFATPRGLWATDAVGTPPRQIDELWSNATGDSTFSTTIGDGLAIVVQSPADSAARVHVTDGVSLRPLPPDQFGISQAAILGHVGDEVAFTAWAEEGIEPHVTDGSPAGTRVLDAVPGPDGLWATAGIEAGSRLLFDAPDPASGGVYATDGTLAGTQRVTDARALVDGPPWHRSWRLGVPLADRALFVAEGADGGEPWISDGTPAGTMQVTDLLPGPGGSRPCWLTSLGDRAIFAATDVALGSELFVTDGTAAGTTSLGDIVSGAGSSWPRDLVALGPAGPVVFTAFRPDTGRELWMTDGTVAGTRLLIEAVPGPEHVDPRHLMAFGNHVVFDGRGAEGSEPWVLDVPWASEAGNCRDDVDNDGDGLTDCADPECAVTRTCDRDLDGVADAGDCAPLDASAWRLPAEIVDLRLTRDVSAGSLVLGWTDAAAVSGSGTTTDVAADPLPALHAGRSAGAACVARGTIGSTWSEPLAARASSYYLVRAVNACGPAAGIGWGDDSLGVARPACP